MELSKAETGSPGLDELMGGGLENRIITQFYGEPGGGKSTLSMLSAVRCLQRGRAVIYIDTEGFSTERFRQISGDNAEEFAKNLFLFEPCDLREQGVMIGECAPVLKNRDVGMIVLDSATALYRTETGTHGDIQRRLGHQVVMLLGYAKRYDIPVIVTNQVYTDIDHNILTGLGGTVLRHISKVIVRITKQESHRLAVLEKHRSRPEGGSFKFLIIEEGIKGV